MGIDQAILVHDPLTQISASLAREGHRGDADAPGWLRVRSSDEEDVAQSLSLWLPATVVWWSLHTVVDLVWIRCFDRGVAVRELRYSGEEGWAQNTGAPLPFENTADLSKWLGRRTLSANPQGYDVIACFVGQSKPPAQDGVDEPNATVLLMLPPELVEEVRDLAARRGVAVATIVGAAWTLGQERLVGELSRPEEDMPTEPETIPPLDLGGSAVKCSLALSGEIVAELKEVMESSDRSRSWLLTRAYMLARAEVLGG